MILSDKEIDRMCTEFVNGYPVYDGKKASLLTEARDRHRRGEPPTGIGEHTIDKLCERTTVIGNQRTKIYDGKAAKYLKEHY